MCQVAYQCHHLFQFNDTKSFAISFERIQGKKVSHYKTGFTGSLAQYQPEWDLQLLCRISKITAWPTLPP